MTWFLFHVSFCRATASASTYIIHSRTRIILIRCNPWTQHVTDRNDKYHSTLNRMANGDVIMNWCCLWSLFFFFCSLSITSNRKTNNQSLFLLNLDWAIGCLFVLYANSKITSTCRILCFAWWSSIGMDMQCWCFLCFTTTQIWIYS